MGGADWKMAKVENLVFFRLMRENRIVTFPGIRSSQGFALPVDEFTPSSCITLFPAVELNHVDARLTVSVPCGVRAVDTAFAVAILIEQTSAKVWRGS
jgi:hypothetical protein